MTKPPACPHPNRSRSNRVRPWRFDRPEPDYWRTDAHNVVLKLATVEGPSRRPALRMRCAVTQAKRKLESLLETGLCGRTARAQPNAFDGAGCKRGDFAFF